VLRYNVNQKENFNHSVHLLQRNILNWIYAGLHYVLSELALWCMCVNGFKVNSVSHL